MEHHFENLNFKMIYHDVKRIQQILLNLQSNAIKFTERGTVSITASNDAEFLFIAIKNTGSGISQEN